MTKDKELPGVIFLPVLRGWMGAAGRKPIVNHCSALGCDKRATTAIDLWDFDSDCSVGKKYFCEDHGANR